MDSLILTALIFLPIVGALCMLPLSKYIGIIGLNMIAIIEKIITQVRNFIYVGITLLCRCRN